MSLNSKWFQNGQPSKLEERKKVRLCKEALTKNGFRLHTFNFDGWPFWNQWEFRDIMYLILKV